eukprot:CAMPEP_0115166486 /NCGR_PEP_ID=MMETSP0227-20121206/74152_1 /TAXON_ID=89957 /ORGANISM="Polarella glacialis, Strain CCMP 1383" /LENGTH=91 /DNA_ID=CAMNT_0002579029 /DNA_START=1196 /DNA_END=1471 /DNA_ORIENTATION=-
MNTTIRQQAHGSHRRSHRGFAFSCNRPIGQRNWMPQDMLHTKGMSAWTTRKEWILGRRSSTSRHKSCAMIETPKQAIMMKYRYAQPPKGLV